MSSNKPQPRLPDPFRPPERSWRGGCRTLVVATLTAVLLAVGLAGPAGAGYGAGEPGPPLTRTITGDMATADVALFGDSIAQVGTPEVQKRLAARGWTLATDNQASRTTRMTVDAVLAQPTLPDRIIMAIGSNDVYNPPVMAAEITRLLAGVAAKNPQARVFWVDVQVARTNVTAAVQLAQQRNTMWVNRQIWAGCTGACTVINWASWFYADPSRFTRYLRDGVHPIVGIGTGFYGAAVVAGVR